METKWLSIQSFKRNQILLDHLNKLLIFYKLQLIGGHDKINQSNVEDSKQIVKSFLERILDFTRNINNKEALMGVDSRLRSFVRSFQEAKSRKRQFKSKLFKETPYEIIELIKNPNSSDDLNTLITSLTELRTIIETHNNVDLRELIEGI